MIFYNPFCDSIKPLPASCLHEQQHKCEPPPAKHCPGALQPLRQAGPSPARRTQSSWQDSLQAHMEHDPHLPQHLLRTSQPRSSWSRSVPKVLLHNPWLLCLRLGLGQGQSHSENFSTAVAMAKEPKFSRRNHKHTQNIHRSSLEGSTSHNDQGDSTFSTCSRPFQKTPQKSTKILGFGVSPK